MKTRIIIHYFFFLHSLLIIFFSSISPSFFLSSCKQQCSNTNLMSSIRSNSPITTTITTTTLHRNWGRNHSNMIVHLLNYFLHDDQVFTIDEAITHSTTIGSIHNLHIVRKKSSLSPSPITFSTSNSDSPCIIWWEKHFPSSSSLPLPLSYFFLTMSKITIFGHPVFIICR